MPEQDDRKGGQGRAALLQQARREAGLTQAELAARAGTTQSVVSAYESGHRQPAIPTLAALVDPAGCELVISVRRQPRPAAAATRSRRLRRTRRPTGPVRRASRPTE